MRRETEIAFAIRKGFPLTELLSNLLYRLKSDGVIDEILKKWLYVPNCSTYQSEEQRFPWFYFGGILLAMVVCVGVSVVVSLMENFYTFCRERKKIKMMA